MWEVSCVTALCPWGRGVGGVMGHSTLSLGVWDVLPAFPKYVFSKSFKGTTFSLRCNFFLLASLFCKHRFGTEMYFI